MQTEKTRRAVVVVLLILAPGALFAQEAPSAETPASDAEQQAVEALQDMGAAVKEGLHELATAVDEARAAAAPAVTVVPPGAFYVDDAVDVPLTLGTGTLFLTLFVTPHRQVVLHTATADVRAPEGLDALGVQELHEGVAEVSDYILFGGIGAGLLLAGLDGWHDDQVWERSIIALQTMAVVGVATELTKWAVRRPRPYTFSERLGEPDDDLSFFSGHTSFTAAWAFSTARAVDLAHELGTGARIGLYGGATVLTVAMGSMRVAAGKHWPTDVLVGAAVGTAVGWLVPELHRSERHRVSLALAPTPGGGQVVAAGRF